MPNAMVTKTPFPTKGSQSKLSYKIETKQQELSLCQFANFDYCIGCNTVPMLWFPFLVHLTRCLLFTHAARAKGPGQDNFFGMALARKWPGQGTI